MKKSLFILLAASVLGTACTKELIDNSKPEIEEIPYELVAHMEGATKTSLGTDNTVNWVAKDKIGMFAIPSTAQSADPTVYRTLKTANSGATATFNGTIPQNYKATYALYPDNVNAKLENEKIYTTLPSIQKPEVGTFAKDVNLAVAKIDDKGAAAFKNVCAILQITLPAGLKDIQSVTLQGNNGEMISGDIAISYNNGQPTVEIVNGNPYVTLHNKFAGSALDRTFADGQKCIFTILPTTFSKGITITTVDKNGAQQIVKTTKALTCTRNQNKTIAGAPTFEAATTINEYLNIVTGKEIKLGDSVYKPTKEINVRYLAKGCTDKTIATDGVYFIEPDVTDVKVTGENFLEIVIIGTDPAKRSTLTRGIAKRFTIGDGSTMAALKNITYDGGTNADHLFAINQLKTKGVDNLILLNCGFETMVKAETGKNTSNYAVFFSSNNTIRNIDITDCDFKLTAGDGAKIISFGDKEDICTFNFFNNIVYGTGDVKNFYIVCSNIGKATPTEYKGATLKNVVCSKNTFVNTYPARSDKSNEAMILVGKFDNSVRVFHNLFHLWNFKNITKKGYILGQMDDQATFPTTGGASSNKSYAQYGTDAFLVRNVGSEVVGGNSIGRNKDKSPFATNVTVTAPKSMKEFNVVDKNTYPSQGATR